MLSSSVILKILIAQYVLLAVWTGCEQNWPKMLYWIGATILACGVCLMK